MPNIVGSLTPNAPAPRGSGRVGPQHITVLRGEIGTGKELIALLLHAQGAVPMFAQRARAESAYLFAPAS